MIEISAKALRCLEQGNHGGKIFTLMINVKIIINGKLLLLYYLVKDEEFMSNRSFYLMDHQEEAV
jgi:hypothetical protein